SKLVAFTTTRPVTTDVPHNNVTRPRPTKTIVTKPHSPPRRTINRTLLPKPSNFSPKVTTVKAPKVNAIKGVQGNWDKGVIDSGCLRHMKGNMSYLFDFEAINGGNVAFSRNPKGGKIIGIKREFSVAGTPQQNGVTERKNKTLIEAAKTMLADLLLPIPFWAESMNYQPLVIGNQPDDNACIKENLDASKVGKETVSTQQYMLLPLCTNRVNAASAPVNVAGLNPTNSTNNFNTASPYDTAVSPNFGVAGKSSFVNPSNYPDDPDMPALEDIVYSDDEEDVGTKADFSNLETNISVSPILTTRVYKDHPVTQIIGFEDPDYPNKVYKVVKALYGLHQAPKAWYETLANYLFENGFQRGKIDQTLFIKKQKGDIFLVQDKFQMSSMGELTFFLGLQVKQKDDGIFISQDKYVAKILRKFGFVDVKSASTPIEIEKSLVKDPDGEDVEYIYTVKRILRYLKGKPHLGLWYPKDSPFNLVAYSDSDYAGASLDRKSTTGGCQFLGCRLISWQCNKQIVVSTSSTEAEYVAAMLRRAKQYEVIGMEFACTRLFQVLVKHYTSNGYQITMSNLHQELTSSEQAVSGKDYSNPLMVDNLPKIV
nr:hypothetical protein [Tanacetum cinerariifolium]